MQRMISFLWLSAVCFICFAHEGFSSVDEEDQWEKAQWIQRVAKVLRQTDGLNDEDDLNELLTKSRLEIIDYFMNDPRFGDASLAAFLHFLGRSVDRIKVKNDQGYDYHPMAHALPQALASARRVLMNQNLELFLARPSLLIGPMQAPLKAFGEKDVKEQRTKILQYALTGFDAYIKNFYRDDQTIDKGVGCQKLRKIHDQVHETLGYGELGLNLAGFDPKLEFLIRTEWLERLVSMYRGDPTPTLCSLDSVSGEQVIATLSAIQEAYRGFFSQIPRFEKPIQSIADFGVIPPIDSLPPLVTPFSRYGFWNQLSNTSTNFNRKRSSYLLRTYFCDELAPIEVEPGDHGSGQHGSDPACLSCHYKLDPLGGLFRHYGFRGTDFKGSEVFYFDDGIELEGDALTQYLNSWKSDQGIWQIGYYIEPGVPHPQWNGNTLEDFMTFASKAKDVQQCFVRRIAEFFIDPEQTFDGGWLGQLRDEFLGSQQSGMNFKHLVKQLLLSRAFAAEDPNPDTCYDLPVRAPSNRPPCRIASILEENCAQCHNKSFAAGGLNLAEWYEYQNGEPSFPHQQNGIQLDKRASFQRIRQRITGTEFGPKMPLNRSMSPTDRQALYGWLSEFLD